MVRSGVILWVAMGLLAQSTVYAQSNPKPLQEIKLSREYLVQILESEFNIHISEENGGYEYFDQTFLSFLYTYFQTISYFSDVPLTLKVFYPKERETYTLVKLDKSTNERTLFFSEISKHTTPDATFEVYQKFLKTKGAYFTYNDHAEFTYSNTLFSQLNDIFLSRTVAQNILLREYGISTSINSSEENYEMQEALSGSALLLILKQFKDLPPSVMLLMKLERIVSMKQGYMFVNHRGEEDENIVARYNGSTQTIKIRHDAFFEMNAQKGEGTVLHEIGHAVWEGMTTEQRNSYLNISWQYNGSKWVTRAGNTEFVSEYSITEPGEDFPEHFSNYLANSKLLFNRAPTKYKWLKESLFSNFEYVDIVAANLKHYIDSENPDTKAPWVENPSSEFLKIKILESTPTTVTIQSDAYGLMDDVSGITSVVAFLYTNNEIASLIFLQPVPNDPGHYSFTHTFSLSKFLPNSKVVLTGLMLKDNAGNDADIGGRSNSVNVSGYYVEPKPATVINLTSNSSPAIFTNSNVENTWDRDDTIVQVSLAVAHTTGLTSAEVSMLAEDGRPVSFRVESNQFNSKPGDTNVRFSLRIPGTTPAQFFTLQTVKLNKGSSIENLYFPDDRRFSIYHLAANQKIPNTPADITVEQVKMRSENERNYLGGSKVIYVEIPVTGIDAGHIGSASATIRTPAGVNISNYMGDIVERRMVNGVLFVTYKVALGPNHARGEYIITELDVSETISAPQPKSNLGTVVNSNDLNIINGKVIVTLGRGIKTTIEGTQTLPLNPPKLD